MGSLGVADEAGDSSKQLDRASLEESLFVQDCHFLHRTITSCTVS